MMGRSSSYKKQVRKRKKKIRTEARKEKKGLRKKTRVRKKDIRKNSREELRKIRKSKLSKAKKKEKKKEVRTEKKSSLKKAKHQKKTGIKTVNKKKKTELNKADPFKYAHSQKSEIKKRTRVVVDDYRKIADGKWFSYLHKNIITPKKIFQPRTLVDLIEIVKEAHVKGIKIKAVGSGHSFSDIYQTNGYLIDTHSMKGDITKELYRDHVKPILRNHEGKRIKFNHLVQIKGGTRISELNKILDKKNLHIINMGSYDGQTFVGAASTSTHGSGIGLPPIPDMILSLVLVTDQGNCYRIEPTNGITNPKTYPSSEPELIQEDDVFYSVIVSMGCMGIIYSVVVEVMDSYVLEENRRVEKWDKLKGNLKKNGGYGDGIKKFRHYEVLINPYINRGLGIHKGNRMSMVTTRKIVKKSVREGKKARQIQGIKKCFARATKFKNPDQVARSLNTAFDFLNLIPHKKHTNIGHKVFILGGAGVGGYACEWSFPMNKYINAVDAILKTVGKAVNDGEQVETGPISLRFVKGSKAYLSPQYKEDRCMIELTMLYGTPGRDKKKHKKDDHILMHRFYDVLLKLGRPHWGLEFNDLNNSRGRLARLYPKWKIWLKVYRNFNKHGTFNNSFTDRLEISA